VQFARTRGKDVIPSFTIHLDRLADRVVSARTEPYALLPPTYSMRCLCPREPIETHDAVYGASSLCVCEREPANNLSCTFRFFAPAPP
jgi:hypothetical protein